MKLYYGWRVVWATFILVALINGLFFSFGLYQKPLIEEFGWSREQLALSATVMVVSFSLSSFIAGMLVDRYGPRLVCSVGALIMGLGVMLTGLTSELWHLYLTYGLIFGVGGGALEKPPSSTVSKFFVKRRGTALGIAIAGIGMGTLVIAPVAQYFIDSLGWRAACLLTGLLPILLGIPVAALAMRTSPESMGLLPDGEKSRADAGPSPQGKAGGFSLVEAVRFPQFWMLFAISTFMNTGLLGVMYHLPAYATDAGVTPMWAAAAVALAGGVSIAGRVITGIASDTIGRRRVLITVFSALVFILAGLILVKTTAALIIWVLFFGFCYGSMVVALWGLVADLFGRMAAAGILGAISIGTGVGGFLGPWVAGYIFDATASYISAFLAFAAAFLLAALFVFRVRPIQHTQRRNPAEVS
ncbi:MAG: MFS transporter [Dehalococcoidales bacterium]|nr:MFS transporter [Dehalococcoidales bacterium]